MEEFKYLLLDQLPTFLQFKGIYVKICIHSRHPRGSNEQAPVILSLDCIAENKVLYAKGYCVEVLKHEE